MTYLTRETARQNAFIIHFEKLFNNYEIQDLIQDAQDNLEMEFDTFCKELIQTTQDNLQEADKLIENNLKNWKINRIAKPSLVILRLAVIEMLFFKDIPKKVTINEYVELAKKYTEQDDVSFINGVLGSVLKQLPAKEQPQE